MSRGLNQVIAVTLNKINVYELTRSIVLLLAITYLPFIIHVQWITGPLVNALLILILFTSGLRTAVLAALAPSLMALSGGLLPIVLAPAVPFIMIGNIIFIFTIDSICKNIDKANSYWLGLFIAASLKYLWLSLSVGLIVQLLLNKNIAPVVSQMMSWPQLVTALAGGLIAYFILKQFKLLEIKSVN